MKRKSQILSSILLASSLLTLVSCGSSSSGGGSTIAAPTSNGGSTDSPVVSPTPEQQVESDQGIYRVVLSPLNTSVAGNTTGTIEIKIDGDDVTVQSNVSNAPEGAKHLQHVMLTHTCPTAAQDANQDSIIDFNEMVSASGSVLLPLDSDLSAQLDGADFGPISNASGAYVYKRSASYTDLMTDLQSPDPDPIDPYAKLPMGNRLSLESRVIVVHGVSSSANLPETVGTVDGISAEDSLPIACGQLVRVENESISAETNLTNTDDSLL